MSIMQLINQNEDETIDIHAATPVNAHEVFCGTITVRNRDTGEYRTFLIKREQPDDSDFFPGRRVVGLLTGPDNYADFQSFGTIGKGDDTIVRVFKKYSAATPTSWQWFGDMLSVLLGKHASKYGKRYENYDVMQERTCRRCGRKLTTPQSIELGIGPECATK